MAKQTRGLGKGLDALIPQTGKSLQKSPNAAGISEVKAEGEAIQKVRITKVEPNREQPRKNFDEDALQELSESIKEHGVISPILVQDKKDHYEIIAGERRWRAAKLAGLKEVPVIVKHYTDQEILEISLIENIQRENLNPIEEAYAYKKLLTEFNLKQDEVAERVSKSRTAVTNSMRLLKLCDKVQQMVIEGMLSTGHARTLIGIEDPEQQYQLAMKIFDEKLSVRDAEKLIKNINKPVSHKNKKETDEALKIIYQELEEKLKQAVGTKVAIMAGENGTGRLEIEFYNHDDLDRISDLLTRG